jgi:hypothetical protein
VLGDSVSDETDEARADGGAQPGGSRWTPRVLLLVPALMQLAVAYLLSQDLRGGVNGAPVLVPVILLALGGAGGIVAGAFGRSQTAFHFGILCALLGFALPAAIHAAATPVDQHTSTIHGLGDFDAEGLGALMFYRMLVELPFWGLYAVIAVVGYVGSRRIENVTVPLHRSSGRRGR